MIRHNFDGGVLLIGDTTSPEVHAEVEEIVGGEAACIVADPPYSGVVDQQWDRVIRDQSDQAEWMLDWTAAYANMLRPGGAFYIWGGYGRPHHRPFYEFLSKVEEATQLEMANFIVWSKKRAYGTKWNYLETQEDCAYFVKGDRKQPAVFNVPYLDELRGYAGYNPKYPAKSPYLRRTNVWRDITELLRGKKHPTEKPVRLAEVMLQTSTNREEWVIDPFAGSGSTGEAAQRLGRRFVLVEQDQDYAELIVERLREGEESTLR